MIYLVRERVCECVRVTINVNKDMTIHMLDMYPFLLLYNIYWLFNYLIRHQSMEVVYGDGWLWCWGRCCLWLLVGGPVPVGDNRLHLYNNCRF